MSTGLSREVTAEFLETRLACPLCRDLLHARAEGWTCLTCARSFPRLGDYIDFFGALPEQVRRGVETDFSTCHAPSDGPHATAVLTVTREHLAHLPEVLARLTSPPRRCLDIGQSLIGDGRLKPYLRAYEDCLSVCCVLDPDPRQLSCRDGRIVMARGIGEALPFADASFEIVLVHSTLDHCIDASRTLDECGRVLVPGGILSIVLNNDRSWAKRLAPGEARRRRLQASRHHNVFVSGTGMVREVRRRGYSVEYFRGGRYLLLPPSLLKGATRAMGTRAMTRTMRLCDRVGDALAPRLGGDFYLLARKGAER